MCCVHTYIHIYCRYGIFRCKAHTSIKLKHTRCFYYGDFTFEYVISTCMFLSKRTLTCACQMYVTIMCIWGSNVHYILLFDASSTDKCTGQWWCGSTPKDELPKARESLANNISSCVIEQASQDVRKDDCHLQHTQARTRVKPSVKHIYSNLHILKFHMWFTFVY